MFQRDFRALSEFWILDARRSTQMAIVITLQVTATSYRMHSINTRNNGVHFMRWNIALHLFQATECYV